MILSLENFTKETLEEGFELLRQLCLIAAPSGMEEKRAEFVKNWLENIGAEGVYIDEAKNIVFPMNCEGKSDITVFCAHTDTVFPMETPLNFINDGEFFRCPGVGDDTCCLVAILMTVKFIIKNKIRPKGGVLFVANACEEGLGNLKGTRQLMKDYAGRIGRFYTVDGSYFHLVNRCVGSHRYLVECKTCGGHSFGAFGNPNAIHHLAALVADLYTISVPVKENCKTTYNVGTIEGGTSVNTIAQNAKMLCEYRSDDAECLAIMQAAFEEKFAKAKALGEGKAEFTVTLVGDRPCDGNIDKKVHEEMIARAKEVSEKYSGADCRLDSGSTDCNIPMSLGVPALCIGAYAGGGAHTREEYVRIDSLEPGRLLVGEIVLDYFGA